MIGLFTLRWDNWQPDISAVCPIVQAIAITRPYLLPPSLDPVPCFQLTIKKCRQKVRWQIAGTDINPGVFVYLPAKEPIAICPFFTYDFRTLNIFWIIDQQGTALATSKILGLMKTLGCHHAKSSEITSFIFTE